MNIFGTNTKLHKSVRSPLEIFDHPEIYKSELLDNEYINKYQLLIGSFEWDISLGRFDICAHVMKMYNFRSAPRQGNMDQVKRIYTYRDKMRNACIKVWTEEPDYSELSYKKFDWEYYVCEEVKELPPDDAQTPMGNYVMLKNHIDANLFHDHITGCSITGILHLVNKTLVDWYSKKHGNMETSTYGSEFVSTRTCVESIIDLRNILQYFSVSILQKSHMFGDNKYVVDNDVHPHEMLHKRDNALCFH